VIVTGRSGYIVSPSFAIRIGSDGGQGVGPWVCASSNIGGVEAALGSELGEVLGYMLSVGVSLGALLG